MNIAVMLKSGEKLVGRVDTNTQDVQAETAELIDQILYGVPANGATEEIFIGIVSGPFTAKSTIWVRASEIAAFELELEVASSD